MEHSLKRCRCIIIFKDKKVRRKDIRHIINESEKLLYLK